MQFYVQKNERFFLNAHLRFKIFWRRFHLIMTDSVFFFFRGALDLFKKRRTK